jgi:uncharacterized membrane protein YdjX (TVP38/TMEM64 family)
MAAGARPIEEKNQPVAPNDEHEPVGVVPSWVKMVLLALGVGVLLSIVYLSPLRHYLGHWQEVSRQVRGFGALAPVVVVVGVALLVAAGFPRVVLCLIAGMALGFWSGLIWAQLGTLLGNYAMFLIVRGAGREWAQRRLSNRPRLKSVLEARGVLGVVLARQLPLPGLMINLACALLPIRHVDFILGTILGQLPQAIPCTLVGAGALQISFARSMGLIGLAVVSAILAGLAIQYLCRRGPH